MNKDWFIFKGTHHLGPFSVEEIVAFFESKEISAQTLIWKEGAEKWEPLSKVQAFAFLFQAQIQAQKEVPPPGPVAERRKVAEPKTIELPPARPKVKKEEEAPPPLPHIPVLPKKVPSAVLPEKEITVVETGIEEDELPPPIPLDAILDPKGEQKFNFDKPKTQARSSRASKYVFFGVAIVFILLVAWFGMNEKNAAINFRLKGVMPVYLERLEMTATKNTPKFEVAMALSLDSNTLYGSTNYDGEIQAVIKLTSVPRRVLGTEDVAVTVKGEFNNHLGKFTRMILTQGTRFLPGEYKVHVEARQAHFINRHFKSLSAISFFKSLNKTYSFDGEALIYPGTPREFEKKISDYKESMLAELQKPFLDKLERIQTFESILNQTSQNYLMELEKAKNGKAISSFEKKFVKEISPLLQSLVVKAHELSQDPKFNEEGKPGVISPYREQVLLGKQIGEMASDMITKTQAIKKLGEKEKLDLKNEFDRRARAIKMQIDLNARQLEQELAKIK